jgi:hypothetical protein
MQDAHGSQGDEIIPMSESRSFKQATQSLFAWFVVFVCGFCLMTTELLASRLVAPYLGLSLDVWTGIIAFVLIGVIFGVLTLLRLLLA